MLLTSRILCRLHNLTKYKMAGATRIIDLRSDTLTKPTREMRNAIAEAEVGDDVYGEDPTAIRFQQLAAEMTGKEAALFVPSGTMGNLISVMCHCWGRGTEVLLGDQTHLYLGEQGGIAQFGSVYSRPLRNLPDGTFSLTELRAMYKTDANPHRAKTALVAVENTLNGKVIPQSFMAELRQVANELQIPVHLDGARVFNAATALKVPVKEIMQHVDTASICLSKGLVAPIGSVIVGSEDFIKRARRMRKALGAGMRQVGILAAAGIISLNVMTKRLQEDHDNAQIFAKALLESGPDLFEFNMADVQTNMVVFSLNPKFSRKGDNGNTAVAELQRRMESLTRQFPIPVKIFGFTGVTARVVFHYGITREDAQMAADKLRFVVQQWRDEI